MDRQFYPQIFKRKSFHLFLNTGAGRIPDSELEELTRAYDSFERLCPDIRTALRIVPADKVNFKRDAEYCLLLYSEKKDHYLMNAGYLGEQLDLYLTQHDIGALWFGVGKPDLPAWEGLDYVIMIAVHKIPDPSHFRKDMFKAKRKSAEEIWEGEDLGVAEIARFAPSALNSQPWFVKNEDGRLTVFRYKKPGKSGLMAAKTFSYYNRIDMGIFLCILEICLAENGICFARTLFPDADEGTFTPVAEYRTSRDDISCTVK